MSVTEEMKEIAQLRKILENLQEKEENSTLVLIDNTSPVNLDTNSKFQDRVKHINIKYHLIQHHVESKQSTYIIVQQMSIL